VWTGTRISRKVTSGLSCTPNNVCRAVGATSAGVCRGPAKRHSKAVPCLDWMDRAAQASGSVRTRAATVLSMDQKQPKYARSEDTDRRSLSRAPSTIALATFTVRIVSQWGSGMIRSAPLAQAPIRGGTCLVAPQVEVHSRAAPQISQNGTHEPASSLSQVPYARVQSVPVMQVPF
jgi:hypothetical protein